MEKRERERETRVPVKQSTALQEGKKIIWTNKTDGQTDDRFSTRSFTRTQDKAERKRRREREEKRKKAFTYIRTTSNHTDDDECPIYAG